MKRDELLDLLGKVDDKFYREATGDEPQPFLFWE